MSESEKYRDDIQEPEEMTEVEEYAADFQAESEKAAEEFSADEFAAEDEKIELNFDGGEEQPAGGAAEEKISATATYVYKAKQMLQDYQDGQKQKTRLASEVKQCEKSVANNEKSVADSVATAIKKRKEDIASSYDKELAGIQDNIDAAKAERQKARNNAVAQRIQRETAPLSQENQELEGQIEEKYRENKVPAICRSQVITGMFFPKHLKNWIIDAVAAVILLFLIPLFIILGMSNHPVGLTFVLFIYVGVLFCCYLYILHHFMLKNTGVNAEVEELRKQIHANDKSIQSISNKIKKSQDEEGYHLEEYDNEIARLQGQMEETVNQRQVALDQFENEVRHQITADVTAAKQEETAAAEQHLEDARKAQVTMDNELSSMEAVIRDEYEPLFGKEMLHRSKLDALAQFCEEHPELTIEEALAQFKNSR